MSDERVFQVDEDGAVPVSSIKLSEAGFRETQDLEQWVIEHPQILGDDIMIITDQFDQWVTPTGERARDRFDVLGLDSEGHLVLAELKRDRAPTNVHLQAITYAALAASFTPKRVAQELKKHLQKRVPLVQDGGNPAQVVTLEQAEAQIEEHCNGQMDEETLRSPRIVLVAGGFNPVTATAVDWLAEQGLDITMQQVGAYRLPSGEKIITVSKLYPLPSAEDFLVTPAKEKAQKEQNQRERDLVVLLVEKGSLEDGVELEFHVNTNNQHHKDALEEWFTKNPAGRVAAWRNSTSEPLIWAHDNKSYKPTALLRKVFEEAVGESHSFPGPQWWKTPSGQTLAQLARGNESKFDWSALHRILAGLPEGRWTSYGDLAKRVGTAAQPLGSHIAACDECQNAWRVLDAQGRSSPEFQWSDKTKTETQQDVLEDEGIVFSSDARAHAAARLTPEELAQLMKDSRSGEY